MDLVLFTVGALVGAVVLVGHQLWLGAQGKQGADGPALELMREHLVWGLFYANPHDPRGWVPRLNGLGITVNMRSPTHVYVHAAVIVLTLGSAIGLVVGILAR